MDQLSYDNFFESFVYSFAATRVLLQRAHEEGFLVEGTVLYASAIDALLRNLTALKTGQRDAANRISLDPAFFIHDDDQFYSERKMYQLARKAGVIDEEVFDQLNDLYDFRNRVVHRFVISGLTYDKIASRLNQYEEIYSALYSQLEAIEQPGELSLDEQAQAKQKILRKLDPG